VDEEEQRCLKEIQRCLDDIPREGFGAELGAADWLTELMFIRGELTGFRPRND
jgi:hypothetical protein